MNLVAKKKYDFSSLDGLQKAFDDSVDEMAEEVLRLIEGLYESAIAKFYADYTPLYYNRTEYTAYGSSGFPYDNELFKPQNFQKIEGGWSVGITVDPSYIPGSPYRANKAWVFERTFKRGIHGINASMAWGKRRPKTFQRFYGESFLSGKSVFSVIKMKGSRVTSNIAYRKNVKRTAISVMENMVPTPSAIVNSEFRKLTRKKNMKQMFNDIMLGKLS